MTSSPDAAATVSSPPPEAPESRPRWWLAVIIFVGGLIVGVLIVAVLFSTTPDFGAAERQAGQGPEATPSNVASVPAVAEARVNAACLRVINQAQDVYRIISGIDDAAADVDLQRLDDIVRRLQPIEPRLARDLQECRVDTQVAGDPTAAPNSPVPTVPEPTASPS
jgi:hypothetical protein